MIGWRVAFIRVKLTVSILATMHSSVRLRFGCQSLQESWSIKNGFLRSP